MLKTPSTLIQTAIKQLHALRKIDILIFQNSLWLLAEKFNRAILGLLIGAWVARYLGPTNFGLLAFAVAYIAFFQSIVPIGADGLVMRELVKNPNDSSKILGTTLVMRLCIGSILWILSFAVFGLFDGWHDPTIILIAVLGSLTVFQAFDTFDLWFQSQNKGRYTAWAKFLGQLISNILKVFLIIFDYPVQMFSFALALDGLMVVIGLLFLYNNNKTLTTWRFSSEQGKLIILESWPYMITGISWVLCMKIDQYMIKNYLGSYELGIYSVVLPLSQVWYLIPGTLMISLAPYVAKQKLLGDAHYYRALLLIFRGLGLCAIFIATFFCYFSKDIILFLYGPQYADSALVLSVHIFTNFFVFQTLAQNFWFVNERKGIYQTLQATFGILIAVVANYFLLPRFGSLGAAISSILAFSISGVFSNAIFAPKIFLMQLGIKPLRY